MCLNHRNRPGVQHDLNPITMNVQHTYCTPPPSPTIWKLLSFLSRRGSIKPDMYGRNLECRKASGVQVQHTEATISLQKIKMHKHQASTRFHTYKRLTFTNTFLGILLFPIEKKHDQSQNGPPNYTHSDAKVDLCPLFPRLTSLDGMFTTPVDLLFSLNFLFSICPFPFLALGPVLFFSLPLLLGDGLSLSLSLQAMGVESWVFSGWGRAFFRLLPGVAEGVTGWCISSSGLFREVPEEDRATA